MQEDENIRMRLWFVSAESPAKWNSTVILSL
jgi:hypothetical protein